MSQKRLTVIGILCTFIAVGTSALNADSKPCRQAEIPKSIVGQVLNHPELQVFLHPEVSGRVPVVLSDHLINPRLSLLKFGKPLRIVPDAQLKSGAFLRFTNFAVGKNVARVEVIYQCEGVDGRFVFRRTKDAVWKLIKAKVREI